MRKSIHQNPKTNITHNDGNLEILSKVINKTKCLLSLLLFSTVVEVLGNAIRQGREKQNIWKDTKSLLFAIVVFHV